jgi:hypothetical protein
MSSDSDVWQPLLDGLNKLRAAWPGGGWAWDPRFKCVTSSFGKEIEQRAREAMAGVLDSEWSGSTFKNAPDPIRTLGARFGGVRDGQFLFNGEPLVAAMHLFGLWWPWGDGATVSLRVGVANCDRPTELYPLIRALFNIA